MTVFNKSRNILPKHPIFNFLIVLGILFALLIGSYIHFVHSLREVNYQIFDFKETVLWVETKEGIFRQKALGLLDNVLLSNDRWKDFDLTFNILNPRDCGIALNYEDSNNFDFILFNNEVNRIMIGTRRDGTSHLLRQKTFPLSSFLPCKIEAKNNTIRLFVHSELVGEGELVQGEGRLGLIVNDAIHPPTIFQTVKITGTLSDGRFITGKSPREFHRSVPGYLFSFLPFYGLIVLVSLFCAFGLRKYRKTRQPYVCLERKEGRKEVINPFTAGFIHFLLAAIIFSPFLLKGRVLIASYDNWGEILPLFFFSKHTFANLLKGASLPLWNPYTHDGVPFFSNHWNMIYYPFNWPVFLFPDKSVLSVLTFKSFIEVFLIGWCAYGFFSIELPSRKWALISSITYQLCSLLIFTLTVFPATSLYFSMTLYLYLVWSIPRRRAVLNYLLIAISVYFILTSANVAFVFYAFLSLLFVSAYRLFSLKKQGIQTFWVIFCGGATGLLMGAIRILPCFWGISKSNRIVENYYTLHDRIFMIVRLFIPEISGWMRKDAVTVLLSKNLNLIFESVNIPLNSQNTFFVYFGILGALLLIVSFLIKTRGGHTFWKIYAGVTLAIALLFQPFWGILSILFFPFNHYHYHTIILPIGLCALIGHTGVYLEEKRISLRKLGRRLWPILVLFQCYILIFLTYLFPQMTATTRLVFLALGGWCFVYFLLRKYRGGLCKPFLSSSIIGFNVLVGFLFLFTSAGALVKPFLGKEALAEVYVIPMLTMFMIFVTTALFYMALVRSSYAGNKKQSSKMCFFPELSAQATKIGGVFLGLILLLMPLLIARSLCSSLFHQLLNASEPCSTYILDLLLAHLKFFLIVQIGIFGIIFLKLRLFSGRTLVGFLVLITILDLLAFNFRFDNITAPAFYNKAFYPNTFSYQDIPATVKEKMDLVNYRAKGFHRANMNGNRNLIFDIPSYTGSIGYMPERFSNFLANFGYPKNIIFIYPDDPMDNQRFLDLSAVKYVVIDRQNFTTRPTALARLNLFHSYEVIENDAELLNRLKAQSFDPHKTILLARKPQELPAPTGKRISRLVPIREASSGEVIAEVHSGDPSLVLFNESYDKGWNAYVDGQRTPIIIANYNFMACRVDAGQHEIRFKYEPPQYPVALKISLIGLVLLISVVLIGFLYKRK